jgi:hypothetical protein
MRVLDVSFLNLDVSPFAMGRLLSSTGSSNKCILSKNSLTYLVLFTTDRRLTAAMHELLSRDEDGPRCFPKSHLLNRARFVLAITKSRALKYARFDLSRSHWMAPFPEFWHGDDASMMNCALQENFT